MVENGEVKMVI